MKDHMRVERSTTISKFPSFPEDAEFRVRPLRLAGYFFGSVAMTAFFAVTIVVSKGLLGKVAGVLGAIFMGFGVLLFSYLAIVRPVWLRLNADGLDYRGKKIAWNQVRQIYSFRAGITNFVAVHGTGGPAPDNPTRRAASSVLIPATFLMPYRQLTDLLLNYKRTWAEAQRAQFL